MAIVFIQTKALATMNLCNTDTRLLWTAAESAEADLPWTVKR